MVQKARSRRRERKARGHLSHLRREEIEGTQFSSHFFFHTQTVFALSNVWSLDVRKEKFEA